MSIPAWSSLRRGGGHGTRTRRFDCPLRLRARTAKAGQRRAMRRSVWLDLRPDTTGIGRCGPAGSSHQ
eukprot:6907697-Lingulodinium_polyedra.AAC.1